MRELVNVAKKLTGIMRFNIRAKLNGINIRFLTIE